MATNDAYAMEELAAKPPDNQRNLERGDIQGNWNLKQLGSSVRKRILRIAIGLVAVVIVVLLSVLITQQLNTQSQAQLAYDLASTKQVGENRAAISSDGSGELALEPNSIIVTGTRDDKLLQDCLTGSLKQTFPDIDYSFYGYNILQGYPLADGRDPGFTRPLFAFDFSTGSHTADCRYMIPHGLTAAPDVSCTTSFTSKLVENSNDLQSSLEAHANVEGGGWGVSFSASASYKENNAEVSTGKTKITQSSADCKYYFTKIDRLDMPNYSQELLKWLERLNHSMTLTGTLNDNDIYSFLDYFGTHFPREVVYGARYSYDSRMSEDSFKSLSERGVSVEVQASYSGLFSVSGGAGMSSSQKAEAQNFQSKTTTRTTSVGAPPPYDGDAMTWASTVKESPVPVQYDLVPIYDLFSPEYTTKPYFSEITRRHIRDKMMSYVSSYCRRLSDSGIAAVCNDASIIKFEGVRARKSFDSINLNLIDCIEECQKRKDCAEIDKIGSSKVCYFGTAEMARHWHNYTSAISYIFPQTLVVRLPLTGFRYDNLVPRLNKLLIAGTSDYDSIADFCAVSCSIDRNCIGFEMSNRTNYNYNCATYTTHSTHLVETSDGYFETQLMSDLAKRNSLNKLRNNWSSFLKRKVKLAEGQIIDVERANCNGTCCKNLCSSNMNCLAAIYSSIRRSCNVILDSMDAKLSLVSGTSKDYVEVYTYSERPMSSWFNITGMHVGDGSLLTTGLPSANDCAKLCAGNVTCRLASWDAPRSACDIHDSDSWGDSKPFVINIDSKLMIPNFRIKIMKFKLYT